MTTSSHALAPTMPRITCPPWCVISEKEHQDDLDNWEGRVLHTSAYVANEWTMTSTTTPDGHAWPDPGETPVMLMHESTPVLPADAERLALRLLEMAREAQR